MKHLNLLRRLSMHWHQQESTHGSIARSFVLVAMYVLIGKIAGAVKEILSARHFGTSSEMDAFLFVFNLVSWPVGISLALLSALLVPLYARLGDTQPPALSRFRSEVHGFVICIGIALGALFSVLLSIDLFLVHLSGLSTDSANAARHFAWPLAVLIPVGIYGALLSVESLAQQSHLNTLLEGVPAIIVCVALLLWTNLTVALLVWATLAGFLCQTLLLHITQSRRGSLPPVRLGFSSDHWRPLRNGLLAMALAQTLQSLTTLIDQFWAARISEGAISTMGYAQRVLFLILGLTMTAIGRATLPVFSRLTVSEEPASLRVMTQWSALLFVLGLAIAAVLWPLTPWIMGSLFERGAFTHADTVATASFIRYGLLQLPFYFAIIVFMQWMLAAKLYTAVAWIAFFNLLLKLLANALLAPFLGLDGLALATSIMYAGSALMIMLALRLKMLAP
jgi:peptidoglycan biosynthesis protein MviN/MurJ (putative lipid II flippase)